MDIVRISSIQRDVPQVWSRASPVHGSGVPLPHTFSLQDNDCEVLVDTVNDGGSDIFPTRELAVVTSILIAECLYGNSRIGSTLGYILAGPRQQILVILTKNYGSQIVTGKNNTAPAFNGTELAVMEVAVDSSANLTSAE